MRIAGVGSWTRYAAKGLNPDLMAMINAEPDKKLRKRAERAMRKLKELMDGQEDSMRCACKGRVSGTDKQEPERIGRKEPCKDCFGTS